MSEFHNPYHFVPAGNKPLASTPLADFDAGSPEQATHARWLPLPESPKSGGAFSGRIICRLENQTPMVLGSAQEEGQPKKVLPFERNGQPTIPGSSLRGMISSIAEAASASALRVLENEVYSFRREMSEGLSAIGMVSIREGKYYLRPLTLPTLTKEFDSKTKRNAFHLPKEYQRLFPSANFKVYVGGSREIRDPAFLKNFKTWTPEKPVYYGRELLEIGALHADGIAADQNWQHLDRQGSHLLARRPTIESTRGIQPWSEELAKNPNQVRGILRILGVTSSRSDEIPSGKRHELFIPYPESMERDFEKPEGTPGKLWREIPISKEALDRFQQLADTRTAEAKKEDKPDEILPYHPHGTSRNLDSKSRLFRLKHGDLVYFKPNGDGTAIAEISLSSIWRGRVESLANPGDEPRPVTTWDFFSRINPNLLPAGAPGKTELTLAELLFGFVEIRQKQENGKKKPASRALASRVCFSYGQFQPRTDGQSVYLPPIILKILASPKPPSPALYFRQESGPKYFAKNAIQAKEVRPNGRKFYLHHGADPSEKQWRTGNPQENLTQKVEVTPLRKNSVFYFHVDFTNLSRLELGCLLYALKPAPAFRHRLGLGKPLGLGAVNLEVATLLLTDRRRRYTSDLWDKAPRFHYADLSPALKAVIPERYGVDQIPPPPVEAQCTIADLVATFAQAAGLAGLQPILSALETLGDPANVNLDVHYPALEGDPKEGDHFKWFVRNDKSQRKTNTLAAKQPLAPVQNGKIPSLTRHLPFPDAPGAAEKTRPTGKTYPPRGNHGSNQSYPPGWQGPVDCKYIGQGSRGTPKFQMLDGGGTGFLDRNATAPDNLHGKLRMQYKITSSGIFFRPV